MESAAGPRPIPGEGDVAEIVVTSLDLHHPWIRLALGSHRLPPRP